MNKNKNRILLFTFIGIFSLFLGVLIYWLFRENTYISKFISNRIDSTFLKQHFWIFNNNFFKHYFVDYLWALSLSCGLHIIFLPQVKLSLILTLIVFLFGLMFELVQFLGYITGTGDIIDIISYLLAGITVNIINYILIKKGKSK